MKHSRIFTEIVLLLVFTSPPQTLAIEEPSVRAGASAVDISPATLPALMNGGFLQSRTNRVADPLVARSLVVSDGQETIAIVIVDSCMFPTTLCDEIKRLATKETGIATNRILISATHTHSAPAAMMCLGCAADEAYVKFVPAQVARAIADAHENLRPAKLGWALVDGADLTNCRRWITRSDRMGTDPFGGRTVRAMMHPGYQNSDYTSPAGPIDPWLSVLSVVSAKDDSPICVMANLSMHYFGAGGRFSADYFGDVARLLEARIGKVSAKASPGFVGIMSQGTSGDLHWMDYSKARRNMSRRQYAEGVADRVLQALKTIEHRSDLSLAMAEKRLTIDRRLPSKERLTWARPINVARLDRPARNRVEVYAQQAQWIRENPQAEVVLQAVCIGELGITAMPNEVYGITGLKLKRQSPLAVTFNLELANGAAGYIPPPEQHRLGGYTTWPARTAGLVEEAEPKIVETLLSLLETVAEKKRRALVPSVSPYSEFVTSRKPIAYWRLEDMDSTQVEDVVGENHAHYRGGVALFLPGPSGSGFTAADYGNRSVYLAGGYVEASLDQLKGQYSVALCFFNALPADVRNTTGVLLSTEAETLLIAGKAAGDQSGKLVLRSGQQSFAGKTRVGTKHWHHLVITRDRQHVRVYLDGRVEPEIDAKIEPPKPAKRLLIGSDGSSVATFDGKVDEVAVFDRALAASDIVDLYVKSGLTSPPRPKPSDVKQIERAETTQPAGPTPTDVDKALKTIHVPDGFKVELVAAEPLVMDPVAIDWGPDGKLWVVEMADYPLGIDGNGRPGGRVRFLEDTNDDGQYDKSTLFAEGLSFPTGVLAWGRGILLTAAPEIVYLEDSSGDGKADVRRVLYSGFLEGNQQLRVNGLRWGLDNWVYCASGSHHAGYGKESWIHSHLTGKKHQIGSRDFRIRPDTGAIDPQSGPSQYGRNRDDWGNWFGVQNSHPLWHYVLADQNIRRNPHFAPPDPKHQVVTPANPPVYPASKLQKRYHSFSESGRFTSACSAMVYRDDVLFDRGTEQHAFTCEPFHNLVQHNLISDDGVSFRFRRDPAEQKIDFFASEDRWCRPVMVRTGPDGALWIVDMYRYMIEHPQWLPQNGKDELRPWYRSGSDRGRIYRVVRSDQPARKGPQLADLSAQELVAALESPSGWQRDTAQRLLVSRKQQSAIEALQALTRKSKQALARLHALCTLDGLGTLSATTLEAAFTDSHAGVRRNAVRIAARVVIDVNKLAQLFDDPDAKVRLELASTLGEYDDPAASAALAKLVLGSDADRYIMSAAISSLNPGNVSAVLASVIQSAGRASEPILLELIGQAVAMGEKETIDRVIEIVCKEQDEHPTKEQFEALARILDGLANRKWPADRLPETAGERIAEIIQQARTAAANRATAEDVRATSIKLLGREKARREDDFKLMERLLVPQSPVVLQRAVVAHLARRSEPSIAEILLAGWRSHSPERRSQILDVLASRGPWAESLRQGLEAGTIRVSELSAPVRQRLRDRGKNAPQWQQALTAKASASRAEVLRQFQPALTLEGDSQRGALVYRELCINCHKVKDEGHEVGPQLGSITNKTKEALLTSILDPSAVVDAKYFSYVIVTEDGRSFSGMLETETGSGITLLAAGGIRETVLRGDIDELYASTLSLMPDGLEQGLTPRDLADLLQFVRETFH